MSVTVVVTAAAADAASDRPGQCRPRRVARARPSVRPTAAALADLDLASVRRSFREGGRLTPYVLCMGLTGDVIIGLEGQSVTHRSRFHPLVLASKYILTGEMPYGSCTFVTIKLKL